MNKPTIEFTPASSFPLAPSASPLTAPSVRVLSEDASRGDKTLVLSHAPGQAWGGDRGRSSQAVHDYWEEVYILRGRMFDVTLQQWFGADHYCCRPPGMPHGPWVADGSVGCEELVFVRYP